MKGTFLSIVLPLYNKESSILRSIFSVLNQTYPNFELLIVNDGSTDNSLRIVEDIKSDKIKIFSKPNSGVSSARNYGIKRSKYNLIAFLDGDDFWEESYLQQMVNLIHNYPEAGIYGSNYFKVDEEEIRMVQENFLAEGFRGYVNNYFKRAKNGFLFQSSSIIINKNKISPKTTFDEKIKIGEDIDYWLRVAYQSKIAFLNTPLSNYNLEGPNSAMKKKRMFQEDFLYYTSKYKEMEENNDNFRRFINAIRIRKIPEVVLCLNADQKEIKHFFSLIDLKSQSFKQKIFMFLPFKLKLFLVRKIFTLV